MAKIEMKSGDLEELYILLDMYGSTYGEDAVEFIRTNIADIYARNTGKDIRGAHNPRMAGRHTKYTVEDKNRVVALRQCGMSYREIAADTGYSLHYICNTLKSTKHPAVS